eukprot:1712268-Alexandrium_andersonii.AAC.1
MGSSGTSEESRVSIERQQEAPERAPETRPFVGCMRHGHLASVRHQSGCPMDAWHLCDHRSGCRHPRGILPGCPC